MDHAATVGIVLAGGASTRMGAPKALLPCPDGTALADMQCKTLLAAGCDDVVVILGADAEHIQNHLACHCVVNPDWETGRITSIQCGLSYYPGTKTYVILPVDTIGIASETLQSLLRHPSDAPFIRPTHKSSAGHVLRISNEGSDILLDLPASKTEGTGVNVMECLRGQTEFLEVTDASILNNINTQEAWQDWLAKNCT